ncbi:MAG: hypothetical protein LBS72_03680 [Oscillospiraceae bacterium]|nr:hypothetical protein [Oscillospiraceae bacterium]
MPTRVSAQERADRRRLRFRVAAGMLDFLGIACCTFLILALFALLVNLFGWLQTDLAKTFAGLTRNVTDAVIIGK